MSNLILSWKSRISERPTSKSCYKLSVKSVRIDMIDTFWGTTTRELYRITLYGSVVDNQKCTNHQIRTWTDLILTTLENPYFSYSLIFFRFLIDDDEHENGCMFVGCGVRRQRQHLHRWRSDGLNQLAGQYWRHWSRFVYVLMSRVVFQISFKFLQQQVEEKLEELGINVDSLKAGVAQCR